MIWLPDRTDESTSVRFNADARTRYESVPRRWFVRPFETVPTRKRVGEVKSQASIATHDALRTPRGVSV